MPTSVGTQLVPLPRPADTSFPQLTGSLRPSDAASYDRGPNAGRRALSPPAARGKICAADSCHTPLPQQLGPGRPRRYCSAACRKRAARQERGAEPRSAATGPTLLVHPFSRRLRDAIDSSGLKLLTISRRLNDEGSVHVSAATLSNWQSGRPPRSGPEDHRRVQALERMLGLRGGELVLLLDPVPTAPHAQIQNVRAYVSGLGGTTGYVLTELQDTIDVDVDGHERWRELDATVRAIEADVDCYWAFYAADTPDAQVDIRGLVNCRVGRIVHRDDVLAVELLFDRRLARGESYAFGVRMVNRSPRPTPPFFRRGTSQPNLERLEFVTRFEVPPRAVWHAEWPRPDQPPVDRARVVLEGTVARLRLRHPAPAMRGLRWAW